MTRPRVAMLTHSTNPRGGVVHALQLSEALTALGAATVLHAPDASGAGFFRAPRCDARVLTVDPAQGGFAERVAARIADYVGWFSRAERRGFDVYHAHDGLSGAALAALKREGLIPGFVRTVHHIDAFADPRLAAWQDASIREADALLTVSDVWRARLARDYGREARVCGNGVDAARFSASFDGREAALRKRFKLDAGPVFLSVGGVEARKNTRALLAAFNHVLKTQPEARFVIAGGASLLDHAPYQAAFREDLAALGAAAGQVIVTGPLPDEDMPALYRIADALVFASLEEGFGLVVLEALASSTPVVVSDIAPFTEYLGPDDAFFCDPHSPASIAAAMRAALGDKTAAHGPALARRYGWETVARRCLDVYEGVRSLAHA
jgi:glycosyltransferase-like protein